MLEVSSFTKKALIFGPELLLKMIMNILLILFLEQAILIGLENIEIQKNYLKTGVS